jgi:hypothetical protein
MRIELYPIVCWLTQDTDQSYDESLDEIIHYFRKPAQHYIEKFCPANRKGYDAVSVIFLVLESLQELIMDQYLPELEVGRMKAVSCVWPRWEESGVRVRLQNGNLATLQSPFPEDEAPHTQSFDDGLQYTFTFYRNDEPGRRRRWVYRLLRDMLRDERERDHVSREIPMDNASAGPTVQASFDKDTENADFLRKLRKMAPDDFEVALRDGEGEGAAKRKSRQRALQTLFAASQILLRGSRDSVASGFCDQLSRAQGAKERKRILTVYFSRYCGELWRELRQK